MTPRGERPWLDAIAHIEAGGEGYDVVLMVVPPGLQDSVQVELSALLRPVAFCWPSAGLRPHTLE